MTNKLFNFPVTINIKNRIGLKINPKLVGFLLI
jgi:hypothetical protein